MMIFFKKKIQETYNSWLRERYGDNLSTHPDFDPNLWMEVGSSGVPEKNQVYGLSNTTAENLHSAHNVSTVGSSPSVSSTQSKFMALKQQYQQLSMNYDELHQIVMEMRSKMGDDTCAVPFWSYGPGNNQPSPPPPPPSPPAPPLF